MNERINIAAGARTRRRRGSSLLEFVMVIPLLGTILSLTYFFGGAMTNQQHVKICDRYLCWKHVRDNPDVPVPPGLNALVFDNEAGSISTPAGAGPTDTLNDLYDEVDDYSQRSRQLAEDAVEDWPHSRSQRVAATFPTDMKLWKQFTGAIQNHHSREGVEWRRGQVSYLEAIRDQFLSSLDSAVQGVPDSTLKNNVRAMYLKRW